MDSLNRKTMGESTLRKMGELPVAYYMLTMEDVLKQIPYYLRDGRDLAELLPRAWAARDQL